MLKSNFKFERISTLPPMLDLALFERKFNAKLSFIIRYVLTSAQPRPILKLAYYCWKFPFLIEKIEKYRFWERIEFAMSELYKVILTIKCDSAISCTQHQYFLFVLTKLRFLSQVCFTLEILISPVWCFGLLTEQGEIFPTRFDMVNLVSFQDCLDLNKRFR